MEEIEVWYSEYELGQFIDMALRWSIEGIYKDRTEARPFSVFTYKVENARANYDKFCSQLNKKLTQNQYWKAIELDLNQKFLPMLNQYLQWYETNKKEFEKFQPYCPYTLMLTIIESTKQEIIKYFPEIANQYLNNMDSFEQLFAKAEIHELVEQNIVSDKLSIEAKRQRLNLMRERDITEYCIKFRTYLNEKNNISFVTDNDFSQYCHKESTFETFVEFIHYRKAETKKNIAQHAKKNAEIQRYNEQQLIAMDILGLTTGENNFNPVQPVFYHIDEVLIKHNLTPKQAEKILKNYTGGLTPTTNKSLTKKVRKHLKWLVEYDTEPPQQDETEAEQEPIERKPVLKPEAVKAVFDILKDFFSTGQQNELKQLLETGINNSQHLIFLDNGNRLADAFKQLKKADVITQCEQKELESWIAINFKYTYRKAVKEYSTRYLNDIISTNKDKCQNPLLNVKTDKTTGKIQITKA